MHPCRHEKLTGTQKVLLSGKQPRSEERPLDFSVSLLLFQAERAIESSILQKKSKTQKFYGHSLVACTTSLQECSHNIEE
jgi:hypothetical protein